MIRDQILGNEKVQPNSKEIEILKANFPQFFDESGQFLQDKFMEMLKRNEVVLSKEGYELKFLGKSYARYLSSTSTETFLAPLVEDNSKPENKDSENLYIIGDNLDALKHLLNSYAGKIKCVYIDPPYNTGSDGFVYPDNFKFNSQELAKAIGIEEEEADRILNLTGKSSHSAWLTFMYPRLILARELLSDDGVIFISIDDNEQANLKMACDEIYGEENFVGKFNWIRKKKGAFLNKKFRIMSENILLYQRTNFDSAFFGENAYTDKKQPIIKRTNSIKNLFFYENIVHTTLEDGIYKASEGNSPTAVTFNKDFEVKDGRVITTLDTTGRYVWTQPFLEEELKKGTEVFLSNQFGFNVLRSDQGEKIKAPSDTIDNKLNVGTNEDASEEIADLFNSEVGIIFDYAKPVSLLKYLIKMTTYNQKDAIVLDFFSGSATTAHAVMQLNAEDGGNRKYIMVQLPEVIKEDKPAYQAGYRTIDEIGRERIRRAAKKIKEETGADIGYGFKTFKLEPVNQNTLNKMIDFNPGELLVLEDMVGVFDTDKSSGKSSILSTWLNEDGYGLTAEATTYSLSTYEADLYKDSLYIINEGIRSEDVMELVKRLETMDLDINRVVAYPYSIDFSVMHELKKNIKNLRNNKSVEVIERY